MRWGVCGLTTSRFEVSPGVSNLDATAYYYDDYYSIATGVTPAMEEKMVGQGSQ